jgi:pimeloyl-ACP methyl ester carboxylesterase
LPDRIQQWLDAWPIPFPSPEHARAFFVSQGLAPDAWIAGLERHDDGLWPAFDATVIVDCIADLAARDYRSSWEAIRCPTLIIRGEHGNFSAEHVEELARALAHGETATIPNAGHDAHVENPGEWLLTLQQFLARRRLT